MAGQLAQGVAHVSFYRGHPQSDLYDECYRIDLLQPPQDHLSIAVIDHDLRFKNFLNLTALNLAQRADTFV